MPNDYGVSDELLAETMRRFAWAFPPESDKEDIRRKTTGQKPRCGGDWEPTRRACIEQIQREHLTRG